MTNCVILLTLTTQKKFHCNFFSHAITNVSPATIATTTPAMRLPSKRSVVGGTQTKSPRCFCTRSNLRAFCYMCKIPLLSDLQAWYLVTCTKNVEISTRCIPVEVGEEIQTFLQRSFFCSSTLIYLTHRLVDATEQELNKLRKKVLYTSRTSNITMVCNKAKTNLFSVQKFCTSKEGPCKVYR